LKYRLYIDEVGNADLKASADPRHQYLSLTGVIMDMDYVAEVVGPRLEALKRTHFRSHPDKPVILHRSEMVNRIAPFHALKDPDRCAAFNADLLTLLDDLAFVVITVVIDKAAHLGRYGGWSYEPYHYCMRALIERYTMFLSGQWAVGDVMAEGRGGREDLALKKAFAEVHGSGTEYLHAAKVQRRLTSKELKVRPKKDNVPGLQLADLIAHPSWRATIRRRLDQPLDATFGARIAELLERSKYRRDPRGVIWGRGRIWL
jgi:hypothetical protein